MAESYYDKLMHKYNVLNLSSGKSLTKLEALKQRIDSIQDKYHFPKLRKVGEFTGDLFIDSGAIVQSGVYDLIPKTPEDYPEGTTSPSQREFVGSIEKDIKRSHADGLIGAKSSEKDKFINILGRILRAFCYYINTIFPDFCYQQGMNFLAGSILLNYAFDSENKTFDENKEEKCFWIFYNFMISHKYNGIYFLGSYQSLLEEDQNTSYWYVSLIYKVLMRHFMQKKKLYTKRIKTHTQRFIDQIFKSSTDLMSHMSWSSSPLLGAFSIGGACNELKAPYLGFNNPYDINMYKQWFHNGWITRFHTIITVLLCIFDTINESGSIEEAFLHIELPMGVNSLDFGTDAFTWLMVNTAKSRGVPSQIISDITEKNFKKKLKKVKKIISKEKMNQILRKTESYMTHIFTSNEDVANQRNKFAAIVKSDKDNIFQFIYDLLNAKLSRERKLPQGRHMTIKNYMIPEDSTKYRNPNYPIFPLKIFTDIDTYEKSLAQFEELVDKTTINLKRINSKKFESGKKKASLLAKKRMKQNRIELKKQQALQREKKLKKMRMQRYFDLEKLKITDLDSYKKSKGLIDIDDPYMGAPLTVYEHTLPHNPSNKRKLLFKYSDQIRGKQWDVSDIVQKQLGFNKWMEPLGISAFATALATSTSVPPLVLPVAAIGAVAASGHSNKLKPISDGVKEIWEKKQGKRAISKEEKKMWEAILEKPVRYLLNVPPYIGLDIMALDGIIKKETKMQHKKIFDSYQEKFKTYVEENMDDLINRPDILSAEGKITGINVQSQKIYDIMKTKQDVTLDSVIMELEKDSGSADFDNLELYAQSKYRTQNSYRLGIILSFNLCKLHFQPDQPFISIQGQFPNPVISRVTEYPTVNISTTGLNTDVEFPWLNKTVKRGMIVGSGLPDEEGDPQNGGRRQSKHTRRRKLRIHKKNTRRVYE